METDLENKVLQAGLRVLLIIHKACKGRVTLQNTNEAIMDILNQTGFAPVFHF